MTAILIKSDTGSAHRIVRNSAINLAAFVLNATFNLLSLLILARSLGAADFGQYSILYTVMLLTQLVSEMGLTTVLACRIAANMEEWKKTAAEATAWLVIIIVISGLGLMGVGVVRTGFTGDSQALILFTLIGFGCGALHVQRFCAAVFQAFELFQYDSIGKVLQSVIFAGSILLACQRDMLDLSIAVMLLILSHALTAGFLAFGYWRRWRYIAFQLNRAVLVGWWAEAGPLGIADVLRRFTWQLDVLLLAMLQTDSMVGVYSVAVRPLATLNWAPQVILMAILPSFARMAGGLEGDRPELANAFSKTIRLLWTIGVPVGVTFFIFAEPAALFLGGTGYLDAVAPMRVLSVVASLLFVSIPFRFLFAAMAKTKIYFLLVLMTLAFESTWGLLVIPSWDLIGASIGNLLGEVFFTGAALITCRLGQIGRIEWRALIHTAFAGLVMGMVLWISLAAPALIQCLALLVSGMIYLVLCVFLNVIRSEEWCYAQTFLSRFISCFARLHKMKATLLPSPIGRGESDSNSQRKTTALESVEC